MNEDEKVREAEDLLVKALPQPPQLTREQIATLTEDQACPMKKPEKSDYERYWWWNLLDEPLEEVLECEADEEVTLEKLRERFLKWALHVAYDPRFDRYTKEIRQYLTEDEEV
jgi:hypothetical protein